MKLLATLAIVLSLAACKKDPPAKDPGNAGGDDDPAVAVDACTAAEDCVAVELECCDDCNGGDAVAVHKDHVDEVVADSARGRNECADTACTEMACADWVPACEAGKCTITRGTFE